MIPVCINGIEYSVPKLKVTNEDISKIVDTSDEWITQRTGIKSRYIASSSETASTLAIEASKKLIENNKSGLEIRNEIADTLQKDVNMFTFNCFD